MHPHQRGGGFYQPPPALQPLPPQRPAKMASAIFSAVIRTGKLVLAQGTCGNTEASTTRNPPTPRTRPAGSVTAIGSSSDPIRQEQVACHVPTAARRTKASQASSSVITSCSVTPSMTYFSIRYFRRPAWLSSALANTSVISLFSGLSRPPCRTLSL